jgi:hypothetical protein
LYNKLNITTIDTTSNRYDWKGKVVNTGKGELLTGKIFFKDNLKQYLSRANLNYRFSTSHLISLNHVYSKLSREVENRFLTDDNQPFKSPNTFKKNVVGLEYKSSYFFK